MKRILLSLLCLLFCASSFAQMKKHVGQYQGIIATDTLSVFILVDLKKDSTYTITVQYGFPKNKSCGFGETKYRGKWLAKKNWIYFSLLPDSDPNFPFANLWDKPPRHQKKMFNSGYTSFLKVSKQGGYYSDKITIHFADDCFEIIWDKRDLIKIPL